jgi:NADH-quinone oxidoreductase subunit G
LQRIDTIATGDPADIDKLAALGGNPGKAPFVSPIDDFYLSNPIARASATMAECSVIAEGQATLTAAEWGQ